MIKNKIALSDLAKKSSNDFFSLDLLKLKPARVGKTAVAKEVPKITEGTV